MCVCVVVWRVLAVHADAAWQEEGEHLRRSLRGISENLDELEGGGLMWHEVRSSL